MNPILFRSLPFISSPKSAGFFHLDGLKSLATMLINPEENWSLTAGADQASLVLCARQSPESGQGAHRATDTTTTIWGRQNLTTGENVADCFLLI